MRDKIGSEEKGKRLETENMVEDNKVIPKNVAETRGRNVP